MATNAEIMIYGRLCNNRTPIANRLQMTGEAILSDLTLVAKNKDFATFSAKFIGDGALSQYS